MENDDVWGEELPDETIDELFRASQSCTQLDDKKKSKNADVAPTTSNGFTQFRIPNIQAKHMSVLSKNPVSFPSHKKSVFVPRKVSKACVGHVTNNVVEDSKAFDDAFQLSKEFHVSSDLLKLSQEVHRQKDPLSQPSCSKRENNFKKFYSTSKSYIPLDSSEVYQGVSNNTKHHGAVKTVKSATAAVKSSKLNGAKSHNSKTLVNTSSLCAELINLQQRSEKVKRNKHEVLLEEQIQVGLSEAPSSSVISERCDKETIHLLPSKFSGLEFTEWKSLDSKPKINIDLSRHTHQSKSTKFACHLNLLKATFPQGMLFGDMLGPSIFEKSQPESPLIELKNVQNFSERKKKKQVHFEKLLADYNRLNNVSMYQNRRTMEHCYTSLHRLILLESLDSTGAKPHVEKIVCEVAALLGDQLALLQELKLSSTELQDLDRELAEMPDRGQALAILLTSPEFWYNKEAGVEARRGLGALAALAALSQHAVNLVLGTTEPSPTIQATLLQKHDTAPYVYKERQSCTRDVHISYRNMRFGFLTLLRDLCTAVRQERRTLVYTGVLTGVMSLLAVACVNCCFFPEESKQLLCKIVKEVVFSRPRIEVVVSLVNFLCVTNLDMQIGKSLCQNSPKDKFIEKCGVVYFHSEDSCVLQVLCCVLESQCAPVGVHVALCHQVVRWLFGSFFTPSQGPHWLQPTADDSRPTCACRRRVAEVTCNLLHRVFMDFVELDRRRINIASSYTAGNGREEIAILRKLRDTLQAGIMLIHRLEDRNPDFMINVANSEGEWQSFVLGCSRRRSDLGLTAEQLRCLEELVASVEVDTVTDINQTGCTYLDVIFEHLWKDNLRYVRRNYVPPRSRSLDLALKQTAKLPERRT